MVLTTNQLQYIQDLISVQPRYNIRSSSMATLTPPPTRSSLKITKIVEKHLLLLVQFFILNLRLGSSANHFLYRPFSFLPD